MVWRGKNLVYKTLFDHDMIKVGKLPWWIYLGMALNHDLSSIFGWAEEFVSPDDLEKAQRRAAQLEKKHKFWADYDVAPLPRFSVKKRPASLVVRIEVWSAIHHFGDTELRRLRANAHQFEVLMGVILGLGEIDWLRDSWGNRWQVEIVEISDDWVSCKAEGRYLTVIPMSFLKVLGKYGVAGLLNDYLMGKFKMVESEWRARLERQKERQRRLEAKAIVIPKPKLDLDTIIAKIKPISKPEIAQPEFKPEPKPTQDDRKNQVVEMLRNLRIGGQKYKITKARAEELVDYALSVDGTAPPEQLLKTALMYEGINIEL